MDKASFTDLVDLADADITTLCSVGFRRPGGMIMIQMER
jgi:hypothetical protein